MAALMRTSSRYPSFVLALVLASFCPTLFAHAFSNSRLYPNAVYRDDLATTPIKISVNAAPESGVTYYVTYFVDHLYVGRSFERAQLYDDGTHGDLLAGDQVWTVTLNFPEPQRPLRLYQNKLDAIEFYFEGRNSANEYVVPAQAYSNDTQLGIVREDLLAARVAVASDVVASSNVVNIRSAAFASTQDAGLIGKRLYQLFADDFDFLTLYRLNYSAGIAGGGVNLHWIKGLNLTRSTTRPDIYGSSGRLMGVVYQRSSLLSREFPHEFGHFFGFYYSRPELDLSGARGLGFHANTSDQRGQMKGGDYLQELASGAYLVTQQPPAGSTYQENNYSPLEQYMMGLVPAEAVEPVTFLRADAGNVASATQVSAAQTQTVTISDLQAVYGARYPDSRSSKKLFRGAFVVVSDDFATDAELTLLNIVAQHFASSSPATLADQFGGRNPPSFAYATDFNGAMDTYVLDALQNKALAIPASLARSPAVVDYFEIAVSVDSQAHSTLHRAFGQAVTVAATLDPASYTGQPADWWVYADAPSGRYWYTLDRGWVLSASPLRVHAGPLFKLQSYKLSTNVLPRGTYEIHFAVDLTMDNVFAATYDSLVNLLVE